MALIYTGVGEFRGGESARGTLREWVFGITIAGEVIYDADTTRLRSRTGDLCIIRPQHTQYWRVPGRLEGGKDRWRCIYCVFTPRAHWLPWLQTLAKNELTVFRLSSRLATRKAYSALRRAHAIREQKKPRADEYAMHYLERVLLLCMDSLAERDPSTLDPRIKNAVDILTRDPNEPLRLEQLAKRCHLSRAHLWLLFQRQVGTTPLQFQERLRIQEAQRRLRSTLDSIGMIAAACGFDDARYFATRFKKQTGMTPRQYRRSTR